MSPLSREAKQELLRAIEFFQGCTAAELRNIAQLTEERFVPAGGDLCRQGAFEDNVFVVVEGQADVTVDGTFVGITRVGEIVGELSMLRTGTRAATLKATSPMHLLVLDPREIDSVLAADPSSASRLSQHGTPTEVDS